MKAPSDMNSKKLFTLLSLITCLAAAPTFAAEAITQFDKAPQPVLTPPPAFPEAKRGTSGIVALVVVVNEDGSVAEAKVSKSTDAAFEAPSLEAISKWKFKPAEVNGQPVKSKITVPIRFSS